MSLLDKLRAAREVRKPIGAHTFVFRRPTDLDMARWRGRPDHADLFKFVVGWDGVNEIDIIPGGDPHPAPFSPDLLTEWLSDRLDLYGPLAEAVLATYTDHKASQQAAVGN